MQRNDPLRSTCFKRASHRIEFPAPDVVKFDDVFRTQLAEFGHACAGVSAKPRHPPAHGILFDQGRVENNFGLVVREAPFFLACLLRTSSEMPSAGLDPRRLLFTPTAELLLSARALHLEWFLAASPSPPSRPSKQPSPLRSAFVHRRGPDISPADGLPATIRRRFLQRYAFPWTNRPPGT
jgi:hypothetical protein